MRLLLSELRDILLREIDASLASRALAGITVVAGPDYETDRFIAALDTKALEAGEVKVLGQITYAWPMQLPVEGGTTVNAWRVETMFAQSASVAVALIEVLLNLRKHVVAARSVSPAAKRFIQAYYSKTKNDRSLVLPISPSAARDAFIDSALRLDEPSQACVYLDPQHVDAREALKRGHLLLAKAAKSLGVGVKDLLDRVWHAQRNAFGDAYRSAKSERPEVKLALSGGEPTVAKLAAALRTDNFEALRDYISKLPERPPADIKAWIDKHEYALQELE